MSEFSVSLAKLAEEANLTIAYTPCELDKIQVTATEVYLSLIHISEPTRH